MSFDYTLALLEATKPYLKESTDQQLYFIRNFHDGKCFFVCGDETTIRYFYLPQYYEIICLQSVVLSLPHSASEPDMLFLIRKDQEIQYIIGSNTKIYQQYESRGYQVNCVQTYIISMNQQSQEYKALTALNELKGIVSGSTF